MQLGKNMKCEKQKTLVPNHFSSIQQIIWKKIFPNKWKKENKSWKNYSNLKSIHLVSESTLKKVFHCSYFFKSFLLLHTFFAWTFAVRNRAKSDKTLQSKHHAPYAQRGHGFGGIFRGLAKIAKDPWVFSFLYEGRCSCSFSISSSLYDSLNRKC